MLGADSAALTHQDVLRQLPGKPDPPGAEGTGTGSPADELRLAKTAGSSAGLATSLRDEAPDDRM